MGVGRTATTVVRRRVESAGGRAAPTLVLIHSIALDLRSWSELIAALPADLDVLAYDVRNHGSALRMAEFSLAACAEDLAQLLDEFGLDRIHLAGLSMGGAIAQEFALRHPAHLAALTLMGTTGRAAGSLAERADAAGREGLAAQVPATLARWFSPGFLAGGGPWIDYAAGCIQAWDVRSWRSSWLALGDRDVLQRLAGVAVPALCLAGEDDQSAPPSAVQELAVALPESTFETVAGPHLFPVESPAATAVAITQHQARLVELRNHEETSR